jgi:hypothetical protein
MNQAEDRAELVDRVTSLLRLRHLHVKRREERARSREMAEINVGVDDRGCRWAIFDDVRRGCLRPAGVEWRRRWGDGGGVGAMT